ncbi:hypothetical protein [Enterobacter ludwigii]|uniref:hypothetical protein n=1 Tax=Enterobacter ludwigii TaxID=299767 RepID=UPI0020268A18|nr:hypothetical protein [Enterobacter ludwigii]MCL9630916.1 hypothetical protein [Enterobacter ludwigii]
MSNKIAAFVKRMEEQGRTLEVNGNFVVITPAAGLSITDMLEMQNLNKKGELADYITKSHKGASQ